MTAHDGRALWALGWNSALDMSPGPGPRLRGQVTILNCIDDDHWDDDDAAGLDTGSHSCQWLSDCTTVTERSLTRRPDVKVRLHHSLPNLAAWTSATACIAKRRNASTSTVV